MDSDEVNSISDTTESLQVASIVKETFYFLIDNRKIPENNGLLQLTALGDTTHPSHMKAPTNYQTIDWIKYDIVKTGDTAPVFRDIRFIDNVSFLSMINSRDPNASNIIPITDITSLSTLLIRNDSHPEVWTSFDDEYVVFDSYDSAIDVTLQQSKTMAFGKQEPAWSQVDTFIPDLDSSLFSLLLNEAKAQAFITLKQVSNSKAEQRARKQRTLQQNKLYRFSERGNYFDRQPNYGRKR